MSDTHPPIEQLERILARPDGDPERAHVERCDRCQATLRMLREFLAPAPMPEAGLDEVEPRLASIVGRIVATKGEPAGSEAPTGGGLPARPATIVPFPQSRTRPRRLLPGLIGIAACLAIAAVMLSPRRPDAPPQFRGNGAASEVAGMHADAAANAVRLSWAAYPGAARYRVLVFDSKAHEVARFESVGAPRVEIPADSLAALAARIAPDEHLLWQVVVLSGRDVIATSQWNRFPLAGH